MRAAHPPTTARLAGGLLAALVAAALLLALPACSGGGGGGTPADPGGDPGTGGDPGGGTGPGPVGDTSEPVRVLATAGQAVSWIESAYDTYGFLPPHATLRAQAVRTGTDASAPAVLDASAVDVFYEAVADENGSINTSSLAKTDFWSGLAGRLFGVAPAAGAGLAGAYMPADAPTPGRQPMAWSAAEQCFVAIGVPVTPIDDAGQPNEAPRFRVVAVDRATGQDVGHVDVAVPVSRERGCTGCHLTGGEGTRRSGVAWSSAADLDRQARENVLLLHDAAHSTALAQAKPVPCALCHFTRSNDVTGWGATPGNGWPTMSEAIHGAHAPLTDGGGAPLFPAGGTQAQTCGRCHASALASRGAMSKAAACADCHGPMTALSGSAPLAAGGSLDGTRDGAPRRAWTDLPRCESCHVGDAVARAGAAGHALAPDGLRLARAYAAGDAAASPLRNDASRFAPAPATPFHRGTGHAGLRCESCHGGAHAEWSRAGGAAFDDAAAVRYQGHAGMLIECTTCHGDSPLPLTLAGPHGMHNVGDLRWASGGHATFYGQDPAACRACHGTDLAGTALSRASAPRTYALPGRTVTIAKDQAIGCGLCHATHATDLAWVDGGHGAAYASDPTTCAPCHGANGEGTSLSTTAAARSYAVNGTTYSLPAGTVVSCSTCHVMHGTDLAWVDGGHGSAYASNTGGCAMCHGPSGAGTTLSTAAASRSYTVSGNTYAFASGTVVGCSTCHVMHATTSTWVTSTHGPLYETDPADCTLCHGSGLSGTLLSKTAAARSYTYGKKTTSFASGETVACSKCHVAHATTSTFVNNHDSLYSNDHVACQMCHGTTLSGTSFSVAAATRTYTVDGRTVTITAGTKVSCTLCHSKP